VAIYARVSTVDQSCEPQLLDLRAYVTARGWQATEFLDHGISGAKERRPALDRLLREVKARHIDVVVVAAFDRFGRSVRHLIETLELFRHLGVEFVSLREQIDTGSPLGQAVFTIIAAIAQLERSLIAERVWAGLRRARADGKRLGRPPLQLDPNDVARVARAGLSVRAAARQLGISPSSYLRARRAIASAPEKGPPDTLVNNRGRDAREFAWLRACRCTRY
jgi:DNA invertase Pin-like site-specific DNA recombinase